MMGVHPLDQFNGRGGDLAVVGRSFAPVRAAARPSPAFGRAKPRFSLAVDLRADRWSKRWWRGVATLGLLCAGAASAMPLPMRPLPDRSDDLVSPSAADEFRALGVASIDQGSATGAPMAATDQVDVLAEAPERPTVDRFGVIAPKDNIARLLARSEVSYAEIATASRLIEQAAGGPIPAGTSVVMTLGRRGASGKRSIVRIGLRTGLDLNITVTGKDGVLSLATSRLAVDSTPLRITGRVGDGLYWSLRASGVAPATAAEYLRAIGTQLDVGSDISPDDRFDLILSHRRAPNGESEPGPLLYAAIDRSGEADLRLMKWAMGGRTDWINPDGIGRQVSTMGWPVSAPITSGFGLRVHPILRFARMHRGIDFGASYGSPIVAAADGQVVRAGWAGGYGQQVRIAHAGGVGTSYSHMSRMVVEPGMAVRQGQLIGYVGSTGLSTGPHLHYEVYKGGAAVNPMGVRLASRALLEGDQLAAFKARLAQLSAIGRGAPSAR